jgi:hypothetical protein
MAAIAAVLVSDLHLHFFRRPSLSHPLRVPLVHPRSSPTSTRAGSGAFSIPVGPVLYGLLIAALLAGLAISIWWSARLRRAAAPGPLAGDLAEDSAGLLDAVESGRTALTAEIDDARAAIIACYLAMEATLATRGAARASADTPGELLTRAVSSGIVRGDAARRLTALFYEARFSSHPLGAAQRDTAGQALDELAAELGAEAVP